jgi:hypothetical protein
MLREKLVEPVRAGKLVAAVRLPGSKISTQYAPGSTVAVTIAEATEICEEAPVVVSTDALKLQMPVLGV